MVDWVWLASGYRDKGTNVKQWLIGPNWLRARDRVSIISGIRFARRVVTRDHGVEYVAEIPSEYVGTAPG